MNPFSGLFRRAPKPASTKRTYSLGTNTDDATQGSVLAQNSIIPRPNTWMRPDVAWWELVDTYWRLPRLRSSIGRHIAGTVGNNHYYTINPEDEHDADEAEAARKQLERIDYAMNLPALNRQIAADAWLSGNSITTKVGFAGKQVIPPKLLPLSSFVSFYLDENMQISKYRRSAVSLGSNVLHNMVMEMRAMQTTQNVKNISEIDAADVLHFSRGHENGLPWGCGIGQPIMRSGIGYTMPDGSKSRAPPSAQQWEMVTDVLNKFLIAGLPRHIASYKDPNTPAEAVDNLADWTARSKPLTHYATSGDVDVKTIGLEIEQKYDAILDHISHSATSTLQDPTENMWTNSGLFSQASSKTIMESMLPHIIGYEYDHKRFVEMYILKPIIDHYYHDGAWERFGIELNWGIPVKPTMDELTQFVAAWRQTPSLQDVVTPQAVMSMYQKAGFEVDVLSDDEIEKNKQERMAMAQQIMQQKGERREDDDPEDDGEDDDPDADPKEARRQQTRYYRSAADRMNGGNSKKKTGDED